MRNQAHSLSTTLFFGAHNKLTRLNQIRQIQYVNTRCAI
jgi:hypothetical protein